MSSYEKSLTEQISTALTPAKEDLNIFIKYLGNNTLFVIWIVAYFLIFWSFSDFSLKWLIILLIMYYLSIKISLSELGESILRQLHDVRDLHTSKEKDRLLPIYNDVYNKALEQTPQLEKDINIYIVDDLTPNAYAIGRKTIVVTKGLMDFMNDEQIKGILAHELGHITNGDTIIKNNIYARQYDIYNTIINITISHNSP